ncbi:DcaP family trimeric outer membrane transporter [Allorhodopirellula solitaria]|uniref:Porin subfamily protein n=1 Tax=Allorhodopirellula solitaria TaxID=2527987 RepID=A0A5C5XUS6_9BACT|nr:DcaP family trimeric outer membrane transporter [Allorhodopirellula solitaria]TWT67066.1 hypothetical protein CA85_19120 [Allorhodopirellula solitaria]
MDRDIVSRNGLKLKLLAVAALAGGASAICQPAMSQDVNQPVYVPSPLSDPAVTGSLNAHDYMYDDDGLLIIDSPGTTSPTATAPSATNSPSTTTSSLPLPVQDNRGQYGGAFPRTAAEYGPPGYVRRRQGGGPASPILVPSTNPVHADTGGQVDGDKKYVTAGSFPNSTKVPGSNISYRWGGLIHLDGMFTFDPMDSTDDFVTSSIPVPAERGQNANFTPRWSRLDFETHADTHFGDVKSYLQVDFFNGNTQGAFGSYPLRLRFAYVDIENWRFGQDASVFMDYDVFPNVIDYEGPGGIMLVRQSLIRYTLPVTQRFKIAVAAEQPFTDMTLVDNAGNSLDGTNIQDMPDFTGHLRYDNHYGHTQLAGIVRKLTYQPLVGEKLDATGYGINFTADVHPWACLMGVAPADANKCSPWEVALTKSRIIGQYAAGYGIARYVEDANGLGLDAAVDANGDLEALYANGWFAGYEHWWSPKWSSNFIYGENSNDSTSTQPDSTYAGSKYLAANVMWVPIANTYVGMEYLWGERENIDGQSARARRIQLGIQYAF